MVERVARVAVLPGGDFHEKPTMSRLANVSCTAPLLGPTGPIWPVTMSERMERDISRKLELGELLTVSAHRLGRMIPAHLATPSGVNGQGALLFRIRPHGKQAVTLRDSFR